MGLLHRVRALFARYAARLPRWLTALIGVLAIGFGVVLAVRPFASLGAMILMLSLGLILSGLGQFGGDARGGARGLPHALAGAVWILAGLAILFVPGLTIRALALIVGISLIFGGLVRLGSIRRGSWDDRVSGALLGLSTIVLGVLALAWPDVTVFLLAAIFGVQLVIFGVDQILAAVHRARRGAARATPPATNATSATPTPETRELAGRPPLRRFARTAGSALALVAALGLGLVSAGLSGTPVPDAFYDAPREVPAEPGELLRAEPFAASIPAGSRAWRILYTTTREEGVPALASGIVVIPEDGGAQRPVIAWAHGTTGYARGCAPSLLEDPFTAGAMPNLTAALGRGWAVVATDYAGLGTAGSQPYLIGEGEGRSVLDAVRAARQLEEASLGAETVLWGHSQGGHAALWAAGLAPGYAPEVEFAGVAAMSPASDLPRLLSELGASPVGTLFGSFVASAYAAQYPEISLREYVRPGGRIPLEEMANRCLTDPATLVSLATALTADQPIWRGDPARGPFLARAAENVPVLPIPSPLLIAQGGADDLVRPAAQAGYVAERCAAGQALEYREYAGYDHMGVVTGESPLLGELMDWTADRFAGLPAGESCG